jgi:4,4'-diaponeurosporenoate glycosyltransferase
LGEAIIFLSLLLLCLCGFALFRKRFLEWENGQAVNVRISVIIPARNEEKNLPALLKSLKKQSLQPYEIIVCDDNSQDTTSIIAKSFDVTVIESPALPSNWTGKSWAIWNGFQKSSGNVLVFLDADVTLGDKALETLVETRAKAGGVISVVPFHYTKKFYERLSLFLYLQGVFVFTSPFEKNNKAGGLYGSCVVTTRTDYEKINGHSSVSAELLDDLNLGKRFLEKGIRVNNYIGYDLVSFRMYPYSLKSQIHGFGKGAILSTTSLMPGTLIFVVLWTIGLLVTGIGAPVFLILWHPYTIPFIAGYILYALQIFYFLRYTGRYGYLVPSLYFLGSMFFVFIILYSVYRVVFMGTVSWKGREIKVRRKGI